MGTRRSVERHQELFIRGINLLFSVCFVVGLRFAFKFAPCPVSPRGSRVLLSQRFPGLAEAALSNWQQEKLALSPLEVTFGSL